MLFADKNKLNLPQIPPRSRSYAGHRCSLSCRSAWGSWPGRAGGPSCASPPPGRPESARRWPRRAAGCTAAPDVCWQVTQRAAAGPGGGSGGRCPPSSRCRHSWGCCHCSTPGPSAPHAASQPPHGRCIHGWSPSWTSHGSQWKTSPWSQVWAPCESFWFLVPCV